MIVDKAKYLIKKILGKVPSVKRDVFFKTERHGSDYGGWNILADSLNSKSIIYSFGVGEDISFDISIIKKYNCNVYTYDPTPRVADWLKSQNLPKQFIFTPIGLAAENKIEIFYTPVNDKHISHSVQPGSDNVKKVEFPVERLTNIMQALNHTYIDVLKMDIEGFEISVLADILYSSISVNQILVEFHHGLYNLTYQETYDSINLLRKNNYQLFYISPSGREYSFISKNKV